MMLESDTKFEEKVTCVKENDMKNWQISTRVHKSLKVGTFIGSFYPK